MSIVEELANKLAIETLKAVEATGDDSLLRDMTAVIADTSSTMEEAFITATRVLQAETRARALLLERLKAFKAAQEAAARDEKNDG